jgi:F-type H+-transporting ATPase subunit epsilon
MERTFHVDIVTPQKAEYKGEACSLIIPTEMGYIGILANHAPLITNLTPGRIIIRAGSGKSSTINSKGKGLLEVFKNTATLLMDSV